MFILKIKLKNKWNNGKLKIKKFINTLQSFIGH
jgi:hypothetical protein